MNYTENFNPGMYDGDIDINITNKKFLSAKLRLPIDIKEQKKIAQFVQTTKKEMAVLQEILENYKKQKQGLMQKLLTGQWRVK